MTTYEHQLPDGRVLSRITKAAYAWVVVVNDNGYGVWRWSETRASAMSYAATLQRRGFDAQVEEVNNGRRVG